MLTKKFCGRGRFDQVGILTSENASCGLRGSSARFPSFNANHITTLPMTAAIAATAGRDERTNAEKSTDEDMTGLVIVTTIAAIVVATTKINYRRDKQSYVSVPAYLRELRSHYYGGIISFL